MPLIQLISSEHRAAAANRAILTLSKARPLFARQTRAFPRPRSERQLRPHRTKTPEQIGWSKTGVFGAAIFSFRKKREKNAVEIL
jgi:hypothetical protein